MNVSCSVNIVICFRFDAMHAPSRAVRAARRLILIPVADSYLTYIVGRHISTASPIVGRHISTASPIVGRHISTAPPIVGRHIHPEANTN